MIRTYCPDDLKRILQIWLESNQKAHSFLPQTYWPRMLPYVREAIPRAAVFVWDEGNGPLGFLGQTGDRVEGLFLLEQVQGKGVGKALLDHAKNGSGRLTLRVYQKNKRALRFYLRERFQVTKKTVDPSTGEAELIMEWVNPLHVNKEAE